MDRARGLDPGCAYLSCDVEARLHPGSWSISPVGVPKKGVNKASKEIFPNFSLKFRVLKLWFLALSEGPGGFRELREAGRNLSLIHI